VELHEQIATVDTKEKLADFVEALLEDLLRRSDQWENPTLERFLEAMQAWIRAMDQNYENRGLGPNAAASWRTFAEILYAAKIYE